MQNFNYHTHTYRCGHADLIEDEEYIKEYIKMGCFYWPLPRKRSNRW